MRPKKPPIASFTFGIGEPSNAFSMFVTHSLKELFVELEPDCDDEINARILSRFFGRWAGDGLEDVEAIVVWKRAGSGMDGRR